MATNGGTTALYAALAALEVGPGDEVIVPPYTFIATVNVVLLHHALPIFVDTDPETHQIDAKRSRRRSRRGRGPSCRST
ncbi:MAG: DegT/DnrJ/EryC1/StrS family aminotransferase [Bryobacterales bacterium]